MVECLPCMLEALGSVLLTAHSMAYVLFLCFSLLAAAVFSGMALSESMLFTTPELPVSTSSLLCTALPTQWRWLGSLAMWIDRAASALSVSTQLTFLSSWCAHFTIFATYFPQPCLPTHLLSVGWAPRSILSTLHMHNWLL